MVGRRSPVNTDYLGPSTKVVIDGVEHTVDRATAFGWDLVGPRGIRPITRSEIDQGEDDGSIKLVRVKGDEPGFALIPWRERRNIKMKAAWMARLHADIRAKVVTTLGKKELDGFTARHLPDIKLEMEDWAQEATFDHAAQRRKKPRKPTAGSVSKIAKPEYTFSAKHLVRLYDKYLENRHPLHLRKKTERMGKKGSRLEPKVEDLIKAEAELYKSEARRTVAGLTQNIRAGIELQSGTDLKPPCETTVANRIGNIPELHKLVTRKGKAKARKHFGPFGEAQQYERVGELVEIDSWNIPLMVLLEKAGVTSEIPGEIVTDLMIVAHRIMVCVVVDKATGYILGMSFGLTESADLVCATLRMAFEDKSRYVAWADCAADWSGSTGIEQGLSDAGPAHLNNQVEAAVGIVCDGHNYAASGLPHLRGLIESVFSTFHKGFISRFIARCFENVVAKGDYAPEERAVLTAEAFLRLMVLYVVDVYHNLVRNDGLRQSPRREYLALAHGAKERPTSDEIRAAFGTRIKDVQITDRGLTVARVQYDSNWLVRHRLHFGHEKVDVIIDEQDIGFLSAELDGQFVTVPARDPEYRGVPLDNYEELITDLRRRFGEQADIDFKRYVAPALLEIERVNRTAEASLAAGEPVSPKALKVQQVYWDHERLKAFEDECRIRIVHDQPPEPDNPPPDIGGALGRRFATRRDHPDEPMSAAIVAPEPSDEIEDAKAAQERRRRLTERKTND